MLLRTETPDDRARIRELTVQAFADAGNDAGNDAEPGEAALLDALFECGEYLEGFSVVAESGGDIVGHVIATRGWVDGDIPLLGLGPISVAPQHQGKGIGAALLAEIRTRASAAGERAIVLLGHTGYYPRFGYVPAIPEGLLPSDPSWGDHFMVLALGGHSVPRGTFRYASPFGV